MGTNPTSPPARRVHPAARSRVGAAVASVGVFATLGIGLAVASQTGTAAASISTTDTTPTTAGSANATSGGS